MDRIDIYAAARSRASWTGRVPLSAMPRLCASLTDGPADRDALLAYACRGFTDDQGRPALELRLDAVLPVRCDRCGRKLALALEAERAFYFVDTQAQLAAIPIDDTPEEALLGSPQFDLAGLIEDEAILQLPISPRHADCDPAVDGAGAVAMHRPDAPAADERTHPFAGLAALRDQFKGPGAAPDDGRAGSREPTSGKPSSAKAAPGKAPAAKPVAGKPGTHGNGASAASRAKKSRSRTS